MRRYNTFGAKRQWGVRLVAALALLLLPSFLAAQTEAEKKGGRDRSTSLFNLAAGPGLRLTGNQFECGLTSKGATCGNEQENPNFGGGFWPRGTSNGYMYRAGLQVLGIIPANAPGFNCTASDPTCWAGDTVGALFNEGRGNLLHGTAITPIYNSLDPEDLANWPTKGSIPGFPNIDAFICDTSLFSDVLNSVECGGASPEPVKAGSQQDSWVLYWDGDPVRNNGRQHPMGILVEQRSLAWNYPVGNESILYFIYKFTNVTNHPLFQALNENRFFGGQNRLPDTGWKIDSIYIAFDSDPDVTDDSGTNYATALLPWQMGITYDSNFFDTAHQYSPQFFHPPFFEQAPGIIGVKYLRSPINPATGQEVGLTSFSLHTNPSSANSPLPDPRDVQQAWRYTSLNLDPGKGDNSCTFDPVETRARRSCLLSQARSDVRFFVGSGPFSLNPGESATIAVALMVAATVNHPSVQSGVNADVKPGIPSLAPGCGPGNDTIRAIDRAAGYIRPLSCPPAGQLLDQFNVEFVQGSLIGKALVAQAIFDNKFLLGFAPESPVFTLVPGDDQVTINWQPSRTETEGDPFFQAAGAPGNPLYDPNYRKLDVEGYRIYRGTSPNELRLIAQFDFDTSTFRDARCVTDSHHITGSPCTDVNEVDIAEPFVQYQNIGELTDGTIVVLDSDTALVEGQRTNPPTTQRLANTGVPYTFVDTDVRNGFTYYYRVTAFDINSILSLPTQSLESTSETRAVIPQGAFTGQLTGIHTVPDPYYATSAYDLSPALRELQFVNLPPKATIRIYSLAGTLVDVVVHDNAEATRATWNLRNRSGQFVGSGVYLFHVQTPEGKSHVGKFTVINGGFADR